jgi:hypothetical protein
VLFDGEEGEAAEEPPSIAVGADVEGSAEEQEAEAEEGGPAKEVAHDAGPAIVEEPTVPGEAAARDPRAAVELYGPRAMVAVVTAATPVGSATPGEAATDTASDDRATAAPDSTTRAPRRRKAGSARVRSAAAVTAAAPARATAAVDSPLSDRVETLEHGLRRVLDEVRRLRGLLADPSVDR